MENRKPTKSEIERRIKNSLVFVAKDKDYQGVYFADKGLRLEVTQDNTIISTTYHKHVFKNITSNGLSMPYIYTKRFIELANDVNCIEKDGDGNPFYSYKKLMDELKDNREKTVEYAIAFYCDIWFYNIFNPLFSIDNTTASSFGVYFDYIYNIAKNSILLGEHDDGLTTKQFVTRLVEKIKEITSGLNDAIMFEKETDSERIKKEVDILQEKEIDEQIKSSSK